MASNILKDVETAMAYKVIYDFFECTGVKTAVDEMESILMFTLENSFWNKNNNPSYVIFCMQQLEALCAAAFVIDHSGNEKEEAVLKYSGYEPGLMKEKDFVARWSRANTWNNFPRNLTVKQYYNPYRAIRKFCSCMAEPQWKKVFADLAQLALSTDTIEEIDITYNLFKVRIRLLQLIEACHLIDARIYWKEVEEEKKLKKQMNKK